MKDNCAAAILEVLSHEGGYVNHPRDPGGCTHHGITLATYRRFIDPAATCADIQRMPRNDAISIYRQSFWRAVAGDDLPSGIDLAVFDWGVNSGPSRAISGLQRCLGQTATGRLSQANLQAAARHPDPGELVRAIGAARLAFLSGLKSWRTFRRGWTIRVRAVEAAALALIQSPVAPRHLPEVPPAC